MVDAVEMCNSVYREFKKLGMTNDLHGKQTYFVYYITRHGCIQFQKLMIRFFLNANLLFERCCNFIHIKVYINVYILFIVFFTFSFTVLLFIQALTRRGSREAVGVTPPLSVAFYSEVVVVVRNSCQNFKHIVFLTFNTKLQNNLICVCN